MVLKPQAPDKSGLGMDYRDAVGSVQRHERKRTRENRKHAFGLARARKLRAAKFHLGGRKLPRAPSDT
jgi:hypothetical protein